MTCIQRRLPGQYCALITPLTLWACAQRSWSCLREYGKRALLLRTIACRTSHATPFQISPSACTSGPVRSNP